MEGGSEFQVEFSGDRIVPACAGQTLLSASLAAGIPHFHACGGHAECSTCRVLVLEGMEKLSPFSEAELKLREEIHLPENIRLACQTQVLGNPVKVRRIILDQSDVSVYIKRKINQAVKDQLGTKKELILFFLDIRNFTPFVEAYLPFDVIHVMRALYTMFDAVLKRFGGLIVDTSGDGFYAVFGLEVPLDVAAAKSISCGYEIHKELQRFNETYLLPFFGAAFQIGIGIHCGEVIVGEVTVGGKDHLSVMGLAVNIASRLQTSTKRLGNSFIVSEDVMKMAAVKMKSRKRTVRLRGVSGTFRVHMIGDAYKPA